MALMALDDDDRAEIRAMLDEGRPASRERSPASRRAAERDPGDWDRMPPTDQTIVMRDIVDARLAELDQAAELAELKAENKALRAEREAARKEGRKPRKVSATGPEGSEEEKPPTMVNKTLTWLFGSTS